MKKILGITLGIMLMAGTAFAFGNTYVYEGDTTNAPVANGGNAEATGVGIGIGVAGAKASVDNKNTNINSNDNYNRNSNDNYNRNDVDVDNDVRNYNEDTNINVNGQDQDQKQGQVQGQLQGQVQGQQQSANNTQSQSANNEGNHQSTDIVIEDKVQHVSPGSTSLTEAKFADPAVVDVSRMQGLDILVDAKDSLTWSEAKMLAKGARGVDINGQWLFKEDVAMDKIKFGSEGTLMGFIYLDSKSLDSNAVAMLAYACKEAMFYGATHLDIVSLDGKSVALGSSWSIGLGGGASIIAGPDGQVAIAPNGGMGKSSAQSFTAITPTMVVAVYKADINVTPTGKTVRR